MPNTSTEHFRLSETQADAHENRLRALLGLLPRGRKLPTKVRVWGWVATLFSGILAAFTRLTNLTSPHALVFDETYYVKDAFSLLRQGFEGSWKGENANNLFLEGDFSALQDTAAYVVHPPLGKWIMAVGQALFGTDNGAGWRFSTAFIGVLAVMLAVRVAMRLFRSPVLAAFAGVAMALDGMGIVLSRTGILDNILAFFVLLGFWAVLVDREHSRGRLARRIAYGKLRTVQRNNGRKRGTRAMSAVAYSPDDPWGPRLLCRPWLVLAGVALGAACAVKWSGIYAVAVFGILAFAWGVSARRIVGARLPVGAGVFREGIPAFFALVPTALATYIAGWTSWFLNPQAYGRSWAETVDPSELPLSWAPKAVNSLLHYHAQMWDFHHSLSSPHTYQSNMLMWLIQGRPVSFFWQGTKETPSTCGSNECVQAITSLGNVAVWWLAVAGLIALVYGAVRLRDWRAWAIFSGYAAMYLPWLNYSDRTIFQFYAVAFLPFVVFCLTYGVALVAKLLGPAHAGSALRASSSFTWSHIWQEKGIRRKIHAFFTSYFVNDGVSALSEAHTQPSPEAHTQPDDYSSTADISQDSCGIATVPDSATVPVERANSWDACSSDSSASERPVDLSTSKAEAVSLSTQDPQLRSQEQQVLTAKQPYLSEVSTAASEEVKDSSDEEAWWEIHPARGSYVLLGGVTVMIVATALFWYPLWTGSIVDYGFWQRHIWFPSWI